MLCAQNIHVCGIVQGVGFRPFVYNAAKKYQINGWVLNARDGVHIHAEGDEVNIDSFILTLSNDAPAAAKVSEISMKEVGVEGFSNFEIRFSNDEATAHPTNISPDLATCDECVQELFDSTNRRYRYPFINCTNCGPRFTIIEGLPYDRMRTSMANFEMCDDCACEYGDPQNRRFHAQPDACFECGPSLMWSEGKSHEWKIANNQKESDAIISHAVELLCEGKILAIKGLGGFHLVCDAQNADAIAMLRKRKGREGKAFAVMMQDIDTVAQFCHVNNDEELALSSPAHPIVLLKKRIDTSFTDGLADGLPELGVMLAYTPLQHLLMHDFVCAGGCMLVMTSGNVYSNPIVTDDSDVFEQLGNIADAIISNDRKILSRYDDSIVRIVKMPPCGDNPSYAIQTLRRARGYAPLPIQIQSSKINTGILAVGPEQKNTLCYVDSNNAFVSQHIGDMENAETFNAWMQAKGRLEELFNVLASVVACDMHPEYLTTKYAKQLVQQKDMKYKSLVQVQHHHAHTASVISENNIVGAVCGVVFDGTGYGIDKTIWGGEVLIANLDDFERFANFAYVPMPGGAAAIKDPLRMAYGVLFAFDLLGHPVAKKVFAENEEKFSICSEMIIKNINCPYTSSVGRLFDAASALLGICTQSSYDGEPAMLLEGKLWESGYGSKLDFDKRYTIDIVKNSATKQSTAHDTSVVVLDAAQTFRAMLDDINDGIEVATISHRFHCAFVQVIAKVCELVYSTYDINVVTLSGGVFMNRFLIEHSVRILHDRGFTVALNKELPPNDGCISFGQAVVALSMQDQ